MLIVNHTTGKISYNGYKPDDMEEALEYLFETLEMTQGQWSPCDLISQKE